MSNPEEKTQIQEEEEVFEDVNEEEAFNEDDQGFYNEEEDEDPNYGSGSQGNGSYQKSNESTPILEFSTPTEEETGYDYQYLTNVNNCRAFYIDFDFKDPFGSKINFTIPTSILPLSVSVVNEFYLNEVLVECNFELNVNDPWSIRPNPCQIESPTFGKDFPGSILVKNRIENFFKPGYKPQTNYLCQGYVLAPQTNSDIRDEYLDILVKEGYSAKRSKKALLFCQNNLEKARDYLITGVIESNIFPLPFNYLDCPLFYLILEICEGFFEMSYCCCICGEKIGIFSLKPFCCNEERCKHSYHKLGVGVSVVSEIKRDPLASDFLISLASCAFYAPAQPPVFDPSPETEKIEFTADFFDKLPSMKIISSRCRNDTDLIQLIGIKLFKVLRFFILSNKAQLMTLSDKLKVKINKFNGVQFLATYVSPESELIFREKKKKFGAKWFWHGSRTDRWYRIMHTGLKDFGNTKYQLHAGPIYGDGIYMSESFNYSFWYCVPAENKYAKSSLPKNLTVIALTENAAVPELRKTVQLHEFTQSDEKACITRVLLVMDSSNNSNSAINYDTLANPPKVPSLRDVLDEKLKRFK